MNRLLRFAMLAVMIVTFWVTFRHRPGRFSWPMFQALGGHRVEQRGDEEPSSATRAETSGLSSEQGPRLPPPKLADLMSLLEPLEHARDSSVEGQWRERKAGDVEPFHRAPFDLSSSRESLSAATDISRFPVTSSASVELLSGVSRENQSVLFPSAQRPLASPFQP